MTPDPPTHPERTLGPRPDRVHVAVAVMTDATRRVLIARRPAQVPQGGLWEFPGGKVAPGEDAYRALRRELDEELGVALRAARPLIRLAHDYAHTPVLLDVWRVTDYTGVAHGREAQPVRWVAPAALAQCRFPAANRGIVSAVRLPDRYLITGAFADIAEGLHRLDCALAAGVRLVQLRAHSLHAEDFTALAIAARARCHALGARLLLNTTPARAAALGADGVHLSSTRLLACHARPLPAGQWVAASVHTPDELQHAMRIGCDFVVAGPVLPTASHPGAATLGWTGFHALSAPATMPVYALGGVGPAQLDTAWVHGAQGIAAIHALWGEGSAVG